jgi:hypothetical protein
MSGWGDEGRKEWRRPEGGYRRCGAPSPPQPPPLGLPGPAAQGGLSNEDGP